MINTTFRDFFPNCFVPNILTHVKPHFLIKILNRLISAILNTWCLVWKETEVVKSCLSSPTRKIISYKVTFRHCCLFISWSKTCLYMRIWLQVCCRTKLYECILTIFINREKSVCCEASCWNLRASSHHLHILNNYHVLQWEFHISWQTERLETSTSINVVLFVFKAGLFYCS